MSAIAENHHVLSIKRGYGEIGKTDGVVEPVKIGVLDASTFPGFCNFHDTTMFRPLESKGAEFDGKSIFLLSLRALAYERAAKSAAPADRERARDEMDRGKPFEMQVAIQSHLYLLNMKVDADGARVSRWWEEYGRAYLNDDLSLFKYVGVQFDEVLPFVAAGVLVPEYDFSGNRLQVLGDISAEQEHLCVNVTVLGGKMVAVFGWIGEEDGPSGRFVASFAGLDSRQQADALLILVSTSLDNVYFRPSWWQTLPVDACDALHRKMGGLGGRPRRADDLALFKQEILSAAGAVVIRSR